MLDLIISMSRAWDEQEVLNPRHADNLIFRIHCLFFFNHFYSFITKTENDGNKVDDDDDDDDDNDNVGCLRVKTKITVHCNMIKIKSDKKGYNLILCTSYAIKAI